MLVCVVISLVIFTFSFGYVCFSRNHNLTVPLIIIYLLEITSLSFVIAKTVIPQDSSNVLMEELWAAKFTGHWLAMSIFTGEYLKVATQLPVIRPKPTLGYCPLFLNIFVLLTAVVIFFGYIAVKAAILWMDWIEFTGRLLLIGTVLIIQLCSVHKIKQMIIEIPGL